MFYLPVVVNYYAAGTRPIGISKILNLSSDISYFPFSRCAGMFQAGLLCPHRGRTRGNDEFQRGVLIKEKVLSPFVFGPHGGEAPLVPEKKPPLSAGYIHRLTWPAGCRPGVVGGSRPL